MKTLTVKQLRDALANLPEDLPLGLSVYNHSWYANRHTSSHGPAYIDVGLLSNGEKIAVIYQGAWPRDGYCVKQLTGSAN